MAGDLSADEVLEAARLALVKWQPRLHLSDWRISVRIGKVEEEHGCEVCVSWRDRAAVVTFPADFVAKMRRSSQHCEETWATDLVEDSLVHELLHVVEEPLASQAQSDLRGWIGQKGDSVANQETWNHVRDWREWWVNHTARVLLEADRSGGWST